MLRKLSILITSVVLLPGLGLSQENEIDLKKFETATGECSVSEKEAINKKAIEENFELFSSFTITDAAIDRRRGASPPTGSKIAALETVSCLKRDGNKMLVASLEPLGRSCGWIDVDNLQQVRPVTSLTGSSMEPCGKVKPLTIGAFCDIISKLNLSNGAKNLTGFCDLEGVNSSTIDAKFVTDNTSSRLIDGAEADLVRREIPLYLQHDNEVIHDRINIFSMSEIYDIAEKPNGDLRALLGVDGKVKGWAELDTGHVWYSNLTTYFSPNGSKDVFLGNIIGGQSDSDITLAKRPALSSFDVKKEYVKFPILFDMREKKSNSPRAFVPQLQIAFIGKFCENDETTTMCTENDSMYSRSLSNLRAADVVFLVDGSKSMKKYFSYVADSLEKFTSQYIGNPDYRFAVAIYGDYLSKSNTRIDDPVDFKIIRNLTPVISTDFQNIKNTKLLIADALSDKPEAVHASVLKTAKAFTWSEDKPNYIIHIADHGDRRNPTQEVFNELLRNNIFYIPIAVEGEEIRSESSDFIAQANRYSRQYLTSNGNPMAAKTIVSYGDATQSAREAIDTALVTATNTISIIENNDQGSILPTLGPAVRDIFNIPDADDIETIAAVGNIETAQIGNSEQDWNYFVALEKIEIRNLRDKMADLCSLLGTGGDQTELATKAILTIVRTLTGDQKTDTEIAQQIFEGAIPLQMKTIIGEGMADFILATQTSRDLGAYKKEFCRSEILLDLIMEGNTKLLYPEEGQDLVWDEDIYLQAADGKDFEWEFIDDLGRRVYYLPLEYLPRPTQVN